MGVRTDTRERMVGSAALLLCSEGVAGTTIAKVLEHSGGPRGSVQFHFPGGRNELLIDALRLIGDQVNTRMYAAAKAGVDPAVAFGEFCRYYRTQLERTGFRAGCPIWAAAQEAYADPDLGPIAASIVEGWTTGLTQVLVAAGHDADRAASLATVCVCSLEGAITMSRLRGSTAPIDEVVERLTPLLAVDQ